MTYQYAERTAFQAKVDEIAAQFGTAVQSVNRGEEQPNWWAEILFGERRGLSLVMRDDRIEVSGIWPTTAKNEVIYPNRPHGKKDMITVAASRSAAAIVEDIRRRLIVDYLTEWEKCDKLARETDASDIAAENLLKKIVTITGGNPYTFNSHTEVRLYPKSGQWYGSMYTTNGASVKLELRSLTADQAERIVRLLAE